MDRLNPFSVATREAEKIYEASLKIVTGVEFDYDEFQNGLVIGWHLKKDCPQVRFQLRQMLLVSKEM